MRPPVSVVMPFGGDVAEAEEALSALRALRVAPGDELILADNRGELSAGERDGVRIVSAGGERSPARARNAGAAVAGGEWLLFVDSDCRLPAKLIEGFFDPPPGARTGALAGQVLAAGASSTLAGRYGEARNFLDQRAHAAHSFLPRAAAANLLVRRAAFAQLGGFAEGLRAAEDTDFTWRLQRAGWALELRERAVVEHRPRTSLRELRRQWRGYAAGRAWLRRRYPGFVPEPAARRAARRAVRAVRDRGLRRGALPSAPDGAVQRAAVQRRAVQPPAALPARRERVLFAALDVLLGLDELAGLALSNRPAGPGDAASERAATVLVADVFPSAGDPLAELAGRVREARVEAAARPREAAPAPPVPVIYREDDGALERARAAAVLLALRPRAVLADLATRPAGGPPTWQLAPAALRLQHHPAPVVALGPGAPEATAQRLRALAAHPQGEPA